MAATEKNRWNDENYLFNSLNSYKANTGKVDRYKKVFSTLLEQR